MFLGQCPQGHAVLESAFSKLLVLRAEHLYGVSDVVELVFNAYSFDCHV